MAFGAAKKTTLFVRTLSSAFNKLSFLVRPLIIGLSVVGLLMKLQGFIREMISRLTGVKHFPLIFMFAFIGIL